MTLAAILGIFVSLAPTPNGTVRPSVVLLQEETKPAAQEQAPSHSGQKPAAAEKEPVPEQAPPATPETSVPSQTPPPPATENPPSKPVSTGPAKPKPQSARTRKGHRTRKRAAKPPADPNETKKVVVSNGSTAEPVIQISSGKPSAPQDVNSTGSLMDATSSNLKKISGLQLSPAQQDMVKQIRAYLEQAKTASGMGDTQGAHNLAFKAHLLSEELLKR